MSIQELQTSYASRPTVSFAGREDAGLSADIVAFTVEEDTAGLARCEMRLSCEPSSQGRYPYLEPDRLRLGRALDITMGRRAGRREVFSGTVTAVEGRYGRDGTVEVVLLAEDALQRLRLTRRSRVFENTSDADIATKIASEHGLTASVDGGTEIHSVLAQLDMSDLAFLRERAASFGADLWLDGTTLHLSARSGDAVLTLTYGAEIVDLTLRADIAGQSTTVGVTGWDVESKGVIDERAGSSDLPSSESDGTLGAALHGEAFGQRAERAQTSVPLTRKAAKALAKGAFVRQARRFVTGTATADGDPRIRVGTRVSLSGVGRLFTGTYAVTRASHGYDSEHGYLTRFDVERAVVSR